MRFSQRMGITPVKSVIQVDSMDADLRNSLWNALHEFYWRHMPTHLSHSEVYERLFRRIWRDYFKIPLDTLDGRCYETLKWLKERYFHFQWYEVYDLVEFVANNYPEKYINARFMDYCNFTLEREVSAYRFIGGRIAPITSEVEIAAIEEALQVSEPLKGVNEHLRTALGLLADRQLPDYRNSIKESISAVEALCKLITGKPNASLGDALGEIGRTKKVELPPSLRQALDKLYGYTSNEDGIRHALMDEPNVDLEDAKFMLVMCSGFVNYLVVKASKAGIALTSNP